MKHLKNIYDSVKSWIISVPVTIEKRLFPKRALLRKRQGERVLLIKQLEASLEVSSEYRKRSSRRGNSFAKETAKIEQNKRFLDAIQNCSIHEFETIASKWMHKSRSLR